MAIVVRHPSLEDYAVINTLGKWFQENSNFKNCGWSDGKVYGLVKSAVDPVSNTLILIAEDEGEVIGFFVGRVVEYFFSDEKIAEDLVMVFKPDRRDGIGSTVSAMILGFKLWAIRKGANEVSVGITSGIAGDGYKKLLERHGFNEAGVLLKSEV
mgnify:FL=1